MATIELYKSKINNMSNYINQAKSAVGDFCVDLSALKSKVLGINSSVCDSVTLRKNLCKFKNCDKSDILERLKNNRSNFFTVYNGYCNLSRFFGYQPAGMERSGMESG